MKCLLAIFLVLAPAFSQEFRAVISGVITDPAAAAVRGGRTLQLRARLVF
jgi:hypothetical protein